MAELKFRPDPAYQKYAAMQKTRHHFFRFTPRTARITFMYVAVIPAIVGYIAYQTDGKWRMRANRRGDSMRHH
ncbi:hypothetical protein ACRE_068160 [Hapsidospora chrysogenum ATCC 11550]|uniref:Uncharacterized protein n=1 Tax=Hapsidospora chrysogenum (strain ATCC 11550 / CBS 779.69 / DSM 880 / IAM 14645 / JCM 23072 / IMI 49137) TaxID=857340 RepID=A0A086SZ92_HAPC1|nr:hypothetical protein ACRE_068160 [Hapsidospora chrysogenum ATCC 11550]